MVSAPALTPVTVPPVLTVALLLRLVQTPPEAKSVNVMAAPTQTADGPVITPELGDEFIVIAFLAIVVPHALLTVYSIVSIPGRTPVTTPARTVASALPALQIPPVVVSVSVIAEPVHTLEGPAIVPVLAEPPIV